MKNLNNKGITLIALAITIIVLLIISAITLNFILGDNGIIKKSQIAKEKTLENSKQESEKIEDLENKLNSTTRQNTNKSPEPELIFDGWADTVKSYNLIEGRTLEDYTYLIVQSNNVLRRTNCKIFTHMIPVKALDYKNNSDLEISTIGSYYMSMHFTSNTTFDVDILGGAYIEKIYGIR